MPRDPEDPLRLSSESTVDDVLNSPFANLSLGRGGDEGDAPAELTLPAEVPKRLSTLFPGDHLEGSVSYGVVPWIRLRAPDGEIKLYLLHQVSLSATLYTFKIDPLRGKIEPGETPEQAASREALEESCYLLDFPSSTTLMRFYTEDGKGGKVQSLATRIQEGCVTVYY
jgi:hypothetical protein